MTEEQKIDVPVSEDLVRKLADSLMAKWIDDPPYELRGAFVNAVKVKLEASPLVTEIATRVEELLAERKEEIAAAAVRAVIEGMAHALKAVYQEIARKAMKAAEKAFGRL